MYQNHCNAFRGTPYVWAIVSAWCSGLLTDYVRNVIGDLFLLGWPSGKTYLRSVQSDLWCVMEHVFAMHGRAREVARALEEPTNEWLLYFLVDTHDDRFLYGDGVGMEVSWRQDLTRYSREYPCVHSTARLLEQAGFSYQDALDLIENIGDYIRNRDFYSVRLTGNYSEPKSMEGQIARLANHTSTDMVSAVRRYWQKGKRLSTPYFLPDVTFEQRTEFVFPRLEEYRTEGKADELAFLLAFLSLSSEDFQHPKLGQMYAEWAKDKDRAIEEMLRIAREEELLSITEVNTMERYISLYIRHFGLKW